MIHIGLYCNCGEGTARAKDRRNKMTFQIRKEADGFRVVSEDKNGEIFDVDGPFDTQEEADKALEFHQTEWKQSHPDGEE